MTKDTTIITAPFVYTSELLIQNYLCISVTGKVYGNYKQKEEIERIRGLNTYRFYHNQKAKDYFACYLLYRDNLERLGIERIKTTITSLLNKHSKSKVALLGYGIANEFCYRYILSDFLNQNNIKTTEYIKSSIKAQKEFWKHNEYKARGHYNLTDELVGKTLEKSQWIFAKTTPKNPHYYTLKKDFDNNELFLQIVSHIRFFGNPEIFEGVLYRVFYYNGYKYWEHPCDVLNEEVILINRKILE
ncbi:hypothetical protein [Tenacibaculum aestuarii]|uniref:hypothetical protein n=1 Tax=Tenacibaculum aestuarii TaxID=362781 RepID=UPI0038951C48